MAALKPEWEPRLGQDHVIALDALAAISDTALTRETAIAYAGNGLPNTFVPARNLIFLTFAGALALALEIAGQPFLDLVVEDTHSCYLGDRTHRHDWGYGCGACPACRLRAQGFAQFIERKPTA
jgi:7-cyano-7-deazaguanine synthase in queuosine biosynthesis